MTILGQLLKKTHKVSFIPYFRSMDKVDWQKICDKMSWNLISPIHNDIEFTLKEIAESEVILTEAMHGAIIADVFRVPWKRIRFFSHIHETEAVSEFKWNDWLSSIKLQNEYLQLPYLNTSLFPKRNLKKYFKTYFYEKQEKEIINALEINPVRIEDFQLSNDQVFTEILKQLKDVVEDFKASKT